MCDDFSAKGIFLYYWKFKLNSDLQRSSLSSTEDKNKILVDSREQMDFKGMVL